MKTVLGRVGRDYPKGHVSPEHTSYPTNSFFVPQYGIFGVAQGITGRDPWMRYADCAVNAVFDGILKAAYTLSETEQKERQGNPESLRQLLVAGSEALVEVSQEAGGPLILSKTAVSITIARLQQHNLDIAYIGDIRIRLVRSNQVVFRNKLHTLGEVEGMPRELRNVLQKALQVPQEPDIIDVQRVIVRPGDLVLISTWHMDAMIDDMKTDWAKYLDAFGLDIEKTSQQLTSLIQASDPFSRTPEGAAWVLVLVE